MGHLKLKMKYRNVEICLSGNPIQYHEGVDILEAIVSRISKIERLAPKPWYRFWK